MLRLLVEIVRNLLFRISAYPTGTIQMVRYEGDISQPRHNHDLKITFL